MKDKTQDKLFEFALCLLVFGIIAWFTFGSGLAMFVYYLIVGKI